MSRKRKARGKETSSPKPAGKRGGRVAVFSLPGVAIVVGVGWWRFSRPCTERDHGIPPGQLVGSSIKTKFELRDGKPVLVRLPEINLIDDKTGKPVGINSHIGTFSDSVMDEAK